MVGDNMKISFKKKFISYLNSIPEQFEYLSKSQIAFFIIGVLFWIYDIIRSSVFFKDALGIFTDFHGNIEYLYMVSFMIFTSVFYFIQIFFKKINDFTIIINIFLNVPFNLINICFILSFTWE